MPALRKQSANHGKKHRAPVRRQKGIRLPRAIKPVARLPRKPAPAKQMHKANVSPNIKRLVAAVQDPFGGPLSGALVPGGPTSVALARRTRVFALTVTGSAIGTECFVPTNCARDPYMMTATGGTDWSAPTIAAWGRDPEVTTNYTLPLGSLTRVVACGVRFECTSALNQLGGVLYHFPYQHDLAGTAGQDSSAWGSISGEIQNAISHQRIGVQRITFLHAPGEDFVATNSYSDSNWTTGLPVNTDQVAGCRFLFSGIPPGTSLTFLVSVSQVVEYYHPTHKNFARPQNTDMQGPALTSTLRTAMTTPGSNASVQGHSEGWSHITRAIKNALGEAYGFVQFLGNNKDAIKNAASIIKDGYAAFL